MTPLPDLNHLSHAEKDALIRALWVQVEALTAQVAELEARLGEPAKTSGNSILPPARDQKANRADKPKRAGPRQGSRAATRTVADRHLAQGHRRVPLQPGT